MNNIIATGDGYSNFTNFSHPTLDNLDASRPGFLGYYLTFLLIETTGLTLVLLTISGLCCNNKVPSPLAVFLINQLLACVLVVLAVGFLLINALALTIKKASTGDIGTDNLPPLPSCRFYLYFFAFGSNARMWSMLAFSITVLVTVKRGQKVFKHVHLVIGVAGVWIICFLLNLHVTLPYPVYAVQFVDGVGCFPHNSIISKSIRYPTIAMWIIVGGLIPLGVSITIPIITLHYIRRNTMSQDSQYNKRIARFALFLVVGNIVNLVGQAVPALIALQSEALGLLLAYASVSISVLPTPVIIIAFFKPVRERVKLILVKICCQCCLQLKSTKQTGATITYTGTARNATATSDTA